MVYRVDQLEENGRNPVTGAPYEQDRWVIFALTDSREYQQFVGSVSGGAYAVRFSRFAKDDWRMALGDFLGYSQFHGKNVILALTEQELGQAQRVYAGHHFQEPVLRPGEPRILVHSTGWDSYQSIRQAGALKSFHRLALQDRPIGAQLGDPPEFSDYVMLCDGGVTGELVVLSRQRGMITMDLDARYVPGARLYLDGEKIAREGRLVRDGCHLKVRDELPLAGVLLAAVTAETVGLAPEEATPREFAQRADQWFFSQNSR